MRENLILSQLICTLELETGRNLFASKAIHLADAVSQVLYPFVRVLVGSYIFLYDIVKCG